MEHINKKLLLAAAAFAALLPSAFLDPAAAAASAMAANLSLRVMEKLVPEATEPPVRFRIQVNSGADRFWEEEPGRDAGISAWQIQILDNSGRKVAYIQGSGNPGGASLPWGGTGPDGEPLPDGFYSARFAWLDGEGKPHASAPESLSLTTPLEIRALAGRKLSFSYTLEGLVITINEKLIFSPGRSEIQPGALPALRDIRAFLAANPENRVTVRGYTDSTGPREANLRLSRERARRVHAFLVSEGIEPGRINYSGLGPAGPLASNATAEGRARNRRVDVVMLKRDEASEN